jgi:hypothetical protein
MQTLEQRPVATETIPQQVMESAPVAEKITERDPEPKRNWNMASTLGRVKRFFTRNESGSSEAGMMADKAKESLQSAHKGIMGASVTAFTSIKQAFENQKQKSVRAKESITISKSLEQSEMHLAMIQQRIAEFMPPASDMQDPFDPMQKAFDSRNISSMEQVAARTNDMHTNLVRDVRSLIADMQAQQQAIEHRLEVLRARKQMLEGNSTPPTENKGPETAENAGMPHQELAQAA